MDGPAVMEPADLVTAETNFQRDEQEQPSSMDAICPAEGSADQDVTRGLGRWVTCFIAFPEIGMESRQLNVIIRILDVNLELKPRWPGHSVCVFLFSVCVKILQFSL